jgi:dienelactone hydrolase
VLQEPAGTATATGRSARGRSVRTLPTVVRYPANGRADAGEHPGAPPQRRAGHFPLIVFSQGFDMPVTAYGGLLDSWARDGFVVAAPTYPHTDPSSAGVVDESDIVNHPADLRYVVSSILSLARSAHGALGVLDARRIAVAGQSDGGDVSLAVAANTCCQIHALRAAVILSGAELPAFGGRYYSGPRVPLLVVQGDADTINPRGCSATLYDGASPPKFYLELFGAGHLPPYVDAGPIRTAVAATVRDFLARYVEGRPSGRRAMARDADIAGLSRLTSAATAPVAQTACPP